MGKLRASINGLSTLSPGESIGAWITLNDGQDFGAVSLMIHSVQGGFARGGNVLVTDYEKDVSEDGKVTYSLDFVNQSDFVVVPNIDIAWSDT